MLESIFILSNTESRHQKMLKEATTSRILKKANKGKGWSLPKLSNLFTQPKEKVTVIIPVNRSLSSN